MRSEIFIGVTGLLWLGIVAFAAAAAEAPPLELVETFPTETTLDHASIPDAHLVWHEMIASATESLAFAEFYASNTPESRLEGIIQEIEAAAARGVTVRFLAEDNFYRTYPETLDRLARCANITVRRFGVSELMGGVLHAKYFMVDRREAFLGSQNFDWRALEHIQELGVRIRLASVVAALAAVFETDWALAGGAEQSYRAPQSTLAFPATVATGQETLRATPLFSPRGWLPDEALWDLPRLIEAIDAAASSVRVQLLSYRTTGRRGGYFGDLDTALRRAAARGVRVEMLLSHWSTRPGTIEALQSLQTVPNITVKLLTVPPWSGGFIPYARVNHAKYLLVDDGIAWIGTSNWEHDYFYASRNVGILIEDRTLASQLAIYFRSGWNAPFAVTVDPCAQYPRPRIGE